MATAVGSQGNAGNNAFKVRAHNPVPDIPNVGPISDSFQDKEKPMAVRTANIMAARGMYFPFGSWKLF